MFMGSLNLNLSESESLIILDSRRTHRHPQHFYPGDLLKGSLLFSNSNDISLFGIVVFFGGFASVKFTKNHKEYSENCEIFKKMCYVYGESFELLTKRRILPAGDHIFPFIFEIPKTNIPCSYNNDPFGQITYSIVAAIQIGLDFVKIANKRIKLKLKSPLHSLGPPSPVLMAKAENLFFNKNSGLKYNIKINKNIFKPGDKIDFVLEMLNFNESKLYHLTIELEQKFTYKEPWEETKKTFRNTKLYSNEITQKVVDFVKLENLGIGVLYPTHFGIFGVKLPIDVEYILRVKVRENNSKLLKGEIPIKIDVSPLEINNLEDSEDDIDNQNMGECEMQMLPAYSELSLLSLAESLPPSYEEAIKKL